MKKTITLFAFCMAMLTFQYGKSQCPTDSIQNLSSVNWQGYFATINDVHVDNITISAGTGVESTIPSYQAYTNPVIQLTQGGYHNFEIFGVESGPYAVGIWIDLNRDHNFSQSEMLVAQHSPSSNGYMSLSVSIPNDAYSDTVDVRIVKLYDPFSNMFIYTDACNFTAEGGEVEDYKAFINCNYTMQWTSFDPQPVLCEMNGNQLSAYSPFGQLYWYNDTNLTPIDSGNFLIFNSPPPDTTFYLQNVIGGCPSPMYQVLVTIFPAPIPTISAPDTLYACTSVTLDAGPGFLTYQWSNGDPNQIITINSGYGGPFSVTVTDGNGCWGTDQIWVAIAPDPPSSYAYVVPDPNICSNFQANLIYDSLIDPGTCVWHETVSGNYIGTGSNIQITFPDTGYYYYTAYINSMCGLDTAHLTFHFELQATVDSLYTLEGITDGNGLNVFCASGNFVTVIAGGLTGQVSYWDLLDITNAQSVIWSSNNDTIYLPTNMMTQGNLYGIVLHMLTAQGCPSVSDTILGMISTPSGLNLPDTAWHCSFPTTLGSPSSNYSIFDVLWNTSDTTFQINVAAPGNYSVTVTDVTTGCIGTQSTYVADGNVGLDVFPDTTVVCAPFAHFDFGPYSLYVGEWDEYNNMWNPMNQYFDPWIDINDQGIPEYIVAMVTNLHMCNSADTTLLLFNGTFTFDLGPNVSTAASSYIISQPYYPGYNYNWMPGNIHTANLTVTTNGTYTLTIDNGQGCNYSDAITINFTTGIEEANLQNNISLAPNPADDHLLITAKEERMKMVQIYDAQGRIVFSTAADQKESLEINTSALSNGYYFVEIVTAENSFKKKLVINR